MGGGVEEQYQKSLTPSFSAARHCCTSSTNNITIDQSPFHKNQSRWYVYCSNPSLYPDLTYLKPLSTKQNLALAICDFLNKSAADGTLSADDRESVEIANGLIAECFHVDAGDAAAVSAAVAGQDLLGIYSVYEKLQGASKSGGSAADKDVPAPTDAQITEAESLKSRGNAAMAAKDYALAISLYGDALALRPNWAVYL